MADIKITDLAAYTDPVSTDVLPIVDVGSDITKKVSIADLLENACLLYTSPSPRDRTRSRMPSSA